MKLKTGVVLWFLIHVALIALGVSVPWKIDSDLYSILPNSDEMQNVAAAEKVLGARTARNITVLVGHENFEMARNAAIAIDNAFKDDSSFDEVYFYAHENALDEMRNFFFEHRYTIQGRSKLDACFGNLETLKNGALQKIYGPFSISNLNRLDEDPFLLGESSFENFMRQSPLAFSRFSVRNGVLVATDSGVAYVAWRAKLSENVPSMVSKNHVLERMDFLLDSLKAEISGLVIAKSGIPFHSYESSRHAKIEVAWISGISVTLILLLLLFVFRSPIPLVATILSIALAIITALSFTWFVFGHVHVFTFVFGTSVIGVSIDYVVHFLTGVKARVANVRSRIIKGLLLGFMTTEFCYIALAFSGFALLRQMAVFSAVGLLSSFLTITLLFHAVFDRSNSFETEHAATTLPMSIPKKFLTAYFIFPKRGLVLMAVAFAVLLFPGLKKLHIHTDLQSLYTMNDELYFGETLNNKLNNLGISKNYFIVEGFREEDVLQREEILVKRLLLAEKNHALKSHLAISNIVPSLKTQRENHEAAKRLLLSRDSAAVRVYLTEIGVENDSAFIAGLNRPAIASLKTIPPSLQSLFDMLWIGAVQIAPGKTEKRFFSAVVPLHESTEFNAQEIVKGLSHVYVVNKVKNINDALTNISQTSLVLVGIAYIVVFFVLVIVYKFKVSAKIIATPIVACLFMASIFGYLGFNFSFFASVGVILTLGIGIDYALFFREGGCNNQVTTLAVMISATTTLISFGSLVFSGFAPVNTFGLAVLLGISCCFLLSPFNVKR
jgi:predicted exporter